MKTQEIILNRLILTYLNTYKKVKITANKVIKELKFVFLIK